MSLVGDRLSLIPVAVALLEEPVAAAWETVQKKKKKERKKIFKII